MRLAFEAHEFFKVSGNTDIFIFRPLEFIRPFMEKGTWEAGRDKQ
jgi:hypothetical protein